jgi:hypothetical protein
MTIDVSSEDFLQNMIKKLDNIAYRETVET